MEVTEKNMLEALKWCVNQISVHMDGDEGSAHIPVSKVNNGFMTPKLLAFASGERYKNNYLSDTYPLTTDLPVGKYATVANFKDNPPTVGQGSICQINVVMEKESRKEITFLSNYSGEIFFKTVYEGNLGAPNDWGKIERSVLLWEGSARNIGTNMQMKDAIGKFSMLRITYDAAGKGICLVPSNSYGEICAIKDINLYDDVNATEFQVIECQIKNTGSGIETISVNKSVTIRNGTATTSPTPVEILRIEGIK